MKSKRSTALQGVKINDKHFEVIVRQMMKKVVVEDPGDTRFLEKQFAEKADFMDENDRMFGMVVVTEAGDSKELTEGQMVTARQLRDENGAIRRNDGKLVEGPRGAFQPQPVHCCRASPVLHCRPSPSSRPRPSRKRPRCSTRLPSAPRRITSAA